MEKYNELKKLVIELEADVLKFDDKGNKSAGVRVRKTLQSIKEVAQALRIEISAKNKE